MYQARGNQHISQLHFHVGGDEAPRGVLALGVAAKDAYERVGKLVDALRASEARWRARCVELADEVQQARVEGRTEALAEVQDQLRASERGLMKAQRMMKEAQAERKKACSFWIAGVVAYAVTLYVAGFVSVDVLNRNSEDAVDGGGVLVLSIVLSIAAFVASFWTPLTLPGPAGEWGRGLAGAVGLG
ncbi:hypothetical protein [Streptomyces violascens]|uniref:hypothetical protein n=1 Tax=Streptomyces violascens TaxID=67381 RepID=UPI001672F058|nr:hypothetical protein [Streptomyces violascens]